MKMKSIIALTTIFILFISVNTKAGEQPVAAKPHFSKIQNGFSDVCSCSGQFSLNGYTIYINIAYQAPAGMGCAQPSWCVPGITDQYR